MTRRKNDAIEVCTGVVKPEWIDINGHMNVAYYVLAFDLAVDALWARLGITEEHIATTGGSTFAVESHVTYKRELRVGEPYRVAAQIIAYDAKREHQFQRMYHAGENYLAATAEWMNLYVDLQTRRVTRWPQNILAGFASFAELQLDATVPMEGGKQMRITDPIYAMKRD